jgi:hypothetical protein
LRRLKNPWEFRERPARILTDGAHYRYHRPTPPTDPPTQTQTHKHTHIQTCTQIPTTGWGSPMGSTAVATPRARGDSGRTSDVGETPVGHEQWSESLPSDIDWLERGNTHTHTHTHTQTYKHTHANSHTHTHTRHTQTLPTPPRLKSRVVFPTRG